ncbi:MAG TPA: hypothetical protein VFV38_30515 [Ktedonobacteraceae bacterium]|nr:hypothetical protein [Ktedonobacteraceae bacterium]
MPKKHQQRPAKEHIGRNNPEKSAPISAGGYKKSETYRQQAMRRENPGKQPPLSRVPASRTMHPGLTHEANSRRRTGEQPSHGGNDARTQALHAEQRARASERKAEFNHDLKVSQRPAAGLGLGTATPPGGGYSAYSIKELHSRLADLTDDELKNITILPTGTRMEEGAQYIDLNHLERGAFVADANMLAWPEHYYVAKKETDYVLWNRLNQVGNPARLDEAGP